MPSRDRPGAAVLRGVGGYLPPRVVTNDDLAALVDTSDEWIRTRTGIRERRFADEGSATSDLAVEAGRRALASAGGPDVDLVVVATSTPDRSCPATAPLVASRLGLGTAAAFDLAAVCSGFVYALAQASAAVLAGLHRRALVIGADQFTSIVDPRDRATSILFGDGAGAVVVDGGDPDEAGSLGAFHLGSDGSAHDLITVPAGGSRVPHRELVDASDAYFRMDGRAVFGAAVGAMSSSSRRALALSGWSVEDVDWFVAHQANERILRLVAHSLGISSDKVVIHLDRAGNTSAASIPLALAAHARTFAPHERILLTAFGGGTTWGAATATWPRLVVQDL
ncbi:beta-ketoacyl-ACP synthase III [Oerskovia jenensis]|uniref:Beta-ketoacyl-[acyl-carrier-protein] synthase III n=1 Tax=Oerskovia jenensis TaxID=162169 RepID=A0ABS2LHD6_9CELL|nr:beta-ketoacyl-ACP synthase III [Oerskovia jenensis]MBM7479523.1 3-oxoacyl-[acyl-carrier-protein] synthase-3 [Oerskovia jenensis]